MVKAYLSEVKRAVLGQKPPPKPTLAETLKARPLPPHEPGYPRPAGRRYEFVFADLHRAAAFDWYLEIGTETGKALTEVRANVVSVDPEFRISSNVIGGKSQAHFFQQTSDDFFASGFLDRAGITFDLAFLDGMHLFEYLLRDFMNAERAMRPDGTIMIHDCVPSNALMAAREWDKGRTRAWTGDVWKLLPILARHRPDLEIAVFDAAPSGIVRVRNLDPESTALRDAYDAVVAEFRDQSLEEFGLDRFNDLIALRDCEELLRPA